MSTYRDPVWIPLVGWLLAAGGTVVLVWLLISGAALSFLDAIQRCP
jgi:hypothetical protein